MGAKGPCGQNMIFYGWNTNAAYGDCDCDYNNNARALIYHKDSNACHFVFTKVWFYPDYQIFDEAEKFFLLS